MTHVTCRLTAKNRDQLRNPALGHRVWATFIFTLTFNQDSASGVQMGVCLGTNGVQGYKWKSVRTEVPQGVKGQLSSRASTQRQVRQQTKMRLKCWWHFYLASQRSASEVGCQHDTAPICRWAPAPAARRACSWYAAPAPEAVDRYLLPANPLRRCCCRSTGQRRMDKRTLDHFIDPAPHTTRAMSEMDGLESSNCCAVYNLKFGSSFHFWR